MGKGDKRSKKGKIFKGSYGVSRPHKIKVEIPAAKPKKAATKKKAAAKK